MSTMAMSSQKKNSRDIYLIGNVLQKIESRKLFTHRQVLTLFFQHHQLSNKTIRDKAMVVASEIRPFWNQAAINTCRVRDIAEKILKLHGEWQNLKKSQQRKASITQNMKEARFQEKLNLLFDIHHPNLQPRSETPEGQLSHGQQGKNRRGFIPNDNSHAGTNENASSSFKVCDNLNEGSIQDDVGTF